MTIFKVIVTSAADKDEASIYKYIEEKFGKSYADEFRTKIIQVFQLLARQPHLGRSSKKKTLRVYIFKQNKIAYQVADDALIIIRILNMKMKSAYTF